MNNIGESPYGVSSVAALDIAASATATKFISSEQKGTPGFTFVGDTSSGLTSEAVGSISVRISGTKKMRVSPLGVEFGVTGSEYTMPDSKGVDGDVLTMDLGESKWKAPTATTPDPLRLSDGSAAFPTYSFSSSPNTGIYAIGGGTVSFSGGGISHARIGPALGFQIGDGSGAGPYNMPKERPTADAVLYGKSTGSVEWLLRGYAQRYYKNATGYVLASPLHPAVTLASLSGLLYASIGLNTTATSVDLGPINGYFLVDTSITFTSGGDANFHLQNDLNGTIQSGISSMFVKNTEMGTLRVSEILFSAAGSPPVSLRLSSSTARNVTVTAWMIRVYRIGSN